ncbi:hypothetical protein GDO81_016345 [Engystomops pustulosus]|uniref:Uncharacterized protein n=1 Tax=Engystomops pustulosus TaxID=76066 RepID=A0AAV7AXQ3_ENGPU|nr:hypothetical protein GDO81_016345 [Engystomops pustulosus]
MLAGRTESKIREKYEKYNMINHNLLRYGYNMTEAAQFFSADKLSIRFLASRTLPYGLSSAGLFGPRNCHRALAHERILRKSNQVYCYSFMYKILYSYSRIWNLLFIFPVFCAEKGICQFSVTSPLCSLSVIEN